MTFETEVYETERTAIDRPRILICTADVGCGHGRAANALTLALRSAGAEVRQIDALESTPKLFNSFYRDSYLAATKVLPKLTGWLYRRTDRAGLAAEKNLGLWIEAMALRRFQCDERVKSADLIVCTHFLCARALSRLRGLGLINTPLAVVVTDQHPHAIWRVRHADLFLVASADAAAELARHGVAKDRIRATGIPIDARFDNPPSRALSRRRHDIPLDAAVALITGGGLGMGGLDRALRGVRAHSNNAFCIVVCGRNEALYDTLRREFAADSDQVRVYGLTQRMHELMAAADVMVGKAGGLTTSEATAIGLPMVLLRPLPGQEEYNAAALIRAGAAVLHVDPYEAGQVAAQLLKQPLALGQMRDRALSFGRRGSSDAAAAAVLELIETDRSLHTAATAHAAVS